MSAINRGRELGDCWDDPSIIPETMLALEGFPQPSAEATHPSAFDAFYDAVDQNCDAKSDFDQDNDGEASLYYRDRSAAVGFDCFDATSDVPDFGFENGGGFEPSDVNSKSEETWYDGTDQNCDGNEYDQDGDGHDWTSSAATIATTRTSRSLRTPWKRSATRSTRTAITRRASTTRRRRIARRVGRYASGDDTDCADANEGSLATPTTDCDDAGLRARGRVRDDDDGRDEFDGGEPLLRRCRRRRLPRCLRRDAQLDRSRPQCARGSRDDPTTDSTIDRTATTRAPEIVGNGDDEDCDGETCYVDGDGDEAWPSVTTVLSTDMSCTGAGEAETADERRLRRRRRHDRLTATDDDSRLGVDDDRDGLTRRASSAVISPALAIRVTGSGSGEWFEV